MVGAELIHLLNYCIGYDISGLKFVCKTFAVFVKKDCTLASYALTDKKASALFLTVKSGGVNLNIIYILQFNIMFKAERKTVARNVRVIC